MMPPGGSDLKAQTARHKPQGKAIMDRTFLLSLPLIMPNQAQKHVTHNEAIRLLDGLVQLSVLDRDLTAPPGSPADGERYIVGSGATGAWAGWDLNIAYYVDGAWMKLLQRPGWRAWVEDEARLVIWNGAAWAPVEGIPESGAEIQNAALLGLGTTADAINPFSAKLNAALWTARAIAEGGTGDLRYTMNKEAAGNVLSLLLQSGWSGRAELGLAGDEDFRIRVSGDGTAWKDALVIDRASGAVILPHTPPALPVLAAEGTSGTTMPANTYVDQSFDLTTRNDFGSGAWDGTTFTAAAGGVYDLSALLGVDGSPSNTSAYFFRNGADILAFNEIMGASGQNTILTRAVLSLAAGDTVSVRMRHNSSTTQAGLSSSVFSVVRMA
jgi:hypothetical protein